MRKSMLWLAFVVMAVASYGQQYDSLISSLGQLIDNKETYEDEKRARIESLHAQLSNRSNHDAEKQFQLLAQLSEEYKTFIYDSAFSYIQRLRRVANEQNDSVHIAYARNKLGFVLLSSGMFKETLDSLAGRSVNGMPDSIRMDYYFIMARTYYDLLDFVEDRFFTPRYLKLGNAFLDSAIQLAHPEAYESFYYKSLRNLKNENNQVAVDLLSEVLTRKNLTQHQIAVAASTMSYYYVSRGQTERAIELLATAAIADIKSATKETAAVMGLAELLFKEGDITNAYNFIRQAMEDAEFYGARQRKIQVGSILPVIAAAKLTNIEEQRKLWLVYSTIITLLTILVFVFAVITVKQLKKRKLAEKALQESNRIKEEYIGYYFNVNSEYVSKIENFKRAIEMKLMTKKVDDIRHTVDAINTKKEREELYTSFDQIFLKLFPEFVTVFNSYFPETERIVLKEGQLMNTELRIFALMRMGIHDPEKIAKILDYSVNTIYNYKARVKGRSFLKNEEFEKKIMEIQASQG